MTYRIWLRQQNSRRCFEIQSKSPYRGSPVGEGDVPVFPRKFFVCSTCSPQIHHVPLFHQVTSILFFWLCSRVFPLQVICFVPLPPIYGYDFLALFHCSNPHCKTGLVPRETLALNSVLSQKSHSQLFQQLISWVLYKMLFCGACLFLTCKYTV